MRGCNTGIRALCQEKECGCKQWIIEWHTPDGRVWGVTEAKTRESAERQRDRDIAFEKAYAVFFQQPMDPNYSNPSAPICDACFPQEPMDATDAGKAAINTAAQLYDEWTRKAEEAVPAFLKGVFLPNTTIANSPFQSTGAVLKDYANAFRDVYRKQKRMRQDLLFTQHERGQLYGSLQGSIRDLQSAAATLDAAYRRLPENARDALEGKVPPQTPASLATLTAVSCGDRCKANLSGQTFIEERIVDTLSVSTPMITITTQASVADFDLTRASVSVFKNGHAALEFLCRQDSGPRLNYCFSAHFSTGEDDVYISKIIECNSESEARAFLSGVIQAAK
jgi:hypothetical protein